METVEKLIISIRFQELLFNKSHKDHHNKIQLVKAWEQVSRETGLSGRLNSKHSLDIFIALTIYLIFLLFGLFASFLLKVEIRLATPSVEGAESLPVEA